MKNFLNLCLLAVVVFLSQEVSAQEKLLNLDDKGAIIEGYDAVAYFTEKKPVKGSPEFTSTHNGAIYHFKSAENKKMFDANPSKYEVQFGGYCAYAASQGELSPTDPEYCYTQVDKDNVERLVCQHNKKANALWLENPDKLLVDADKYWPQLEANGGKTLNIAGVKKDLLNLDKNSLAVQGYDVVAYHKEKKAVKGDPSFTEWYHGAKYYFTTAENKKAFRDNGKKYIPQYGGFCAYAMSLGKLRPVDPTIWSIEDGRLFLQHTQKAYDLFYEDAPGNIKKADEKWPEIEKKKAGKKLKYDKQAH